MQSCFWRHPTDCTRFLSQNKDGLSWSSLPWLAAPVLNLWWRLLTNSLSWDFIKGISSFHFRWGSFLIVPVASSPDQGEDTTWSGKWWNLVPGEGPGTAGVVMWETTRVDSSLVEDTWEGMFKRVARGMFPMSKWRGPLVPHRLLGAGLQCCSTGS